MKMCAGCKRERPVADFGAHKRRADGLRGRCRECEQKPPRVGTCAVCNSEFEYKQRGPAVHICAADKAEHHWCHACKTARPHADFYRQADTPTGLSYKSAVPAL